METLDWRVFLLERPPGTKAIVTNAIDRAESGRLRFDQTRFRLDCIKCGRETDCELRNSYEHVFYGQPEVSQDFILSVVCIRCPCIIKSYAVRFGTYLSLTLPNPPIEAEKLGEWPEFSPPTHPKLISLVGPDKELFLKGRRAELAGLGIGAMAYYRRIVEDQKNRLLGEIIRVARKVSAPESAIKKLEEAMVETQFSRAVESVKDAIPTSLYIYSQNPFTLLHKALSKNLHGMPDAACLSIATSIRIVLLELAKRLADALEDQRELQDAVKQLNSL
jgi:hypothetical protein